MLRICICDSMSLCHIVNVRQCCHTGCLALMDFAILQLDAASARYAGQREASFMHSCSTIVGQHALCYLPHVQKIQV